MKTLFPLVLLLALLVITPASSYAARACIDGISYPTTPKINSGTSVSVRVSVDFDCGEIDDPRSFSLSAAPSWMGINTFNGRVVASPPAGTPNGTYTGSVSTTWYCGCNTTTRYATVTVIVDNDF